MIETQFERRIRILEEGAKILENDLRHVLATADGYRLALEEAERQIAHLTRLHVCEAQTGKPVPPRKKNG